MNSIIANILLVLALAMTLPEAQAQQRISLQDAVDLAITRNPELAARQLEVEKSKQQRLVSRSLLLPSVGLSAQANHYFQRAPFFGFGEVKPDDKISYGRFGGEDQFGTFISASQPLYNPQAYPSIQYARLKEEESSLAFSESKQATQAAVKQVYLQILVLNERIGLQHESMSRNKRALQDAKSLFFQGRGLRVDTLRAYTAVKNLEPDLQKLTAAVETNKLQLKALMGVDSLEDVQLTDSLFLPKEHSIPTEDEVYSKAKTINPAYKALALQESLTEQQMHIASSARLPVVAAVAQYGLQTQTNNFEYGNAYYPSSSFVGIQLSVPLFTGLSNHAKVKQARLSKEQAALRTDYAYDQLRSTVHQIVAAAHESLARMKSAADVQETAQLSYNITQYRYKQGIASRLEFTDAEFALSTAQSNYLEAVYDYLSARIVLEQISGDADAE